jgi:hypothetical protein
METYFLLAAITLDIDPIQVGVFSSARSKA